MAGERRGDDTPPRPGRPRWTARLSRRLPRPRIPDDPGLFGLKAAARLAIVAPALLAFAYFVVDDVRLSLFAWFGAFAMLDMVEFEGPVRSRLTAYGTLAGIGMALIGLGTLCSQQVWLATVATALVAFVVLFSGVISSYVALAGRAALLAFILPVMTPGPVSAVWERLAGWALAAVVSIAAVMLLWPERPPDRLRAQVAATCRALADGVAWSGPARRRRNNGRRHTGRRDATGGRAGAVSAAPGSDEEEQAAAILAQVTRMRRQFVATSYRPGGMAGRTAALERLVVDVNWLVPFALPRPERDEVARRCFPDAAAEVHDAAAATLTATAWRIDPHRGKDGPPSSGKGRRTGVPVGSLGLVRLDRAERSLRAAVLRYLQEQTEHPPRARARAEDEAGRGADSGGLAEGDREAVDREGAEPAADLAFAEGFRLRCLARGTHSIAAQVLRLTAAEAASAHAEPFWRVPGWPDRARQKIRGAISSVAEALELAAGYASSRSVWFRNSTRAAVGLALAVGIAHLTGVQHGFWVVLGTLSVLRTTALQTGTKVLEAVLGAGLGIVAGGLFVVAIGNRPVLLWLVLPVVVLVAGYARRYASFAASQGCFTVAVLILFNIVEPAGWRVGLVRIQDVAIGFGVGLGVGLLMWPRGVAQLIWQRAAGAFWLGAELLVLAAVPRPDAGGDRPQAEEDWWNEPGPPFGEEAFAERALDGGRARAEAASASPAAVSPATLVTAGIRDIARGRTFSEAAREAVRAGWLLDDAVRHYLADVPGGRRLDVDALMTVVDSALRLRRTAWQLRSDEVPPWPAGLPQAADAWLILAMDALELHRWYLRLADAVGDGVPGPPPAAGPRRASSAGLGLIRDAVARGTGADGRSAELDVGIALLARAGYLDILRDLEPMISKAVTALARAAPARAPSRSGSPILDTPYPSDAPLPAGRPEGRPAHVPAARR